MNHRLLIVLSGSSLLAGLFLVLEPRARAPDPSRPPVAVERPVDSTSEPAASSRPGVRGSSRRFDLVVRGRRLVSGPATLSVEEGDEVTIGITSDRAEELHLHGYDRKLDLMPGVAGTLSFEADRSGRFEYELERSRVALGALEVQPRGAGFDP